jgi:large subunit ribosomal protein L32
MGALPKKRITRGRQGKRRAHDHIKLPTLARCPQCNSLKLTHHVCPDCGTYQGFQVLKIKSKAKE